MQFAREREFISQINKLNNAQQSVKWQAASGDKHPSMLAAHNNKHNICNIMTEKKQRKERKIE